MNRRRFLSASAAFAAGALLSNRSTASISAENFFLPGSLPPPKIVAPPPGRFYHGVYPGRPVEKGTGSEDDIVPSDVESYESTVNRRSAWVYFSDNWHEKQEFPCTTANWIRRMGSVPFIRLMLRTDFEHNNEIIVNDRRGCRLTNAPNKETKYTLDFILRDTKTRDDLRRWGDAARQYGAPLIVEWGTEMNGYWFAWNGWWNGKAEGVEKFKEAYRYIHRQITIESGADNITWVFHVNGDDSPDVSNQCEATFNIGWNRFENYYPGDFIDWFGVSIYGAQKPTDTYCTPFSQVMRRAYPRLAALRPDKPIFVLEFGATMNNNGFCGPDSTNCTRINGAAKWADEALTAILAQGTPDIPNGQRWTRLRGFSWWNEWWRNDDDNPRLDTNMRVQDVPCLKDVFRKHLVTSQTSAANIVDRPIIQ